MLKNRLNREKLPLMYIPDDSETQSSSTSSHAWSMTSSLRPDSKKEPEAFILEDLSHYRDWRSKAEAFIEHWKQSGRDETRREKLLKLIGNAEPFQNLKSTEEIFAAVEFSYEHCLAQLSCRIPIQPKDMCRYSCCWYCESALAAIDTLVKEVSVTMILRPEISAYRETEAYLSGYDEVHWFVVSIGWFEAAGGQQRRVFNLPLGSGMLTSNDKHDGG